MGAGLRSVREMITAWANLAASLCATVHVNLPNKHLTPAHGHDLLGLANMTTNHRVDPSLRFHDFINITFKQNGQSAVVDDVKPRAYNSTENTSVFTTASPEEFVGHFLRAEGISFGQGDRYLENSENVSAFVWKIGFSYYQTANPWRQIVSDRFANEVPELHIQKRLLPSQLPRFRKIGGFKLSIYVKVHPPEPIMRLTAIVGQRLHRFATEKLTSGMGEPIIGILQLRRGDSKDLCDTSLSTMQSYLQCSLWPFNNRSNVPSVVVVALATDETDLSYRKTVTRMIDDINEHVHGIDLDALIWTTFAEESAAGRIPPSYLNNYHVYEVLMGLSKNPNKKNGIHFNLQRRRHIACNACDEDLFLKGLQKNQKDKS